MFTKAIVKSPCKNIAQGLSTNLLGKPRFTTVKKQHKAYINALQEAGLSIEILEEDNKYPDSAFVEDTAVCAKALCVITNPGAKSRKGETSAIEAALKNNFTTIEYIKEPGTLDGGDVMKVDRHFYIGLSQRTNSKGATQIIAILQKHGYTASIVNLSTVLHLKTAVSYIENNNLLVSGEMVNREEFKTFNKTIIPPHEAYAANSLWINGVVIVPEGFPETRDKIKALRYKVITVDVSEFRKLDGGLSCLSLRF